MLNSIFFLFFSVQGTTSKEDTLNKATKLSSGTSNSGVVVVDYTQYLKDANLTFDRNDNCKYLQFFYFTIVNQ